MEVDTNEEKQENEKEALKAIYGEEIVFLNSDDPKLWTPLECILTFRLNSVPVQASPVVSLHITCTKDYPNVIPTIKLEEWKKIPNVKISQLELELINLAKYHQGEVMIFQLAEQVESFLHSCYQPGYESFYEEMVKRNQNKKEEEQKIKEAESKKKKQEMRQQIHIKQQAVKKALRKRQNSVKSTEEIDNPPSKDVTLHGTVSETCTNDFSEKKIYEKKEEDNPWTLCEKGQSRFNHEFEHLEPLGQGAFGHVIKVRNKLDDGLYAIKKIVLNPSEKQLNKKITREVKLLSRLNHENVVRYYNSWIEPADPNANNDDILSVFEDVAKAKSSVNLGVADHALEMLPLREHSIDWISDSSSSSDDSDNYIVFGTSNSGPKPITESSTTTPAASTVVSVSTKPTIIMYIQMELCDKSTLRLAIDGKLYSNMSRVWRLFREIVEGLCHIHEQGIIHRDLKPVNIFIGHDDHVKIGDFGLATTILLQKQNVKDIPASASEVLSQQTDTSQTGEVGTALYVAPELKLPIKSYNQKVDIYSLGIIFFEMCSPPMTTGMERFQILTDLRRSVPIFPQGFHLDESSPQLLLVRSMLQHDFDKRPTALELLHSPAIPPPKREESEVSIMIKRTLANPQSRNYKFLISSCFDQSVQPSLDATYNVSSWRSQLFTSSLEVVSNKLRSIFQNHGATSFLPPAFTPASHVQDSTVCLMTRSGSIVFASHDLQLPFARYLAQNPSINQMKRYAIDKVYRERPAGVHPKESYDCTFDIVTPSPGDMLPEYEILCVIWDILNTFPSLISRNCTIYLNHANLIYIMLREAGLDEKTLKYKFFQKNCLFMSRPEREAYLKSLGLSERNIAVLLQWMNVDGPFSLVSHSIKALLKNVDLLEVLQIALNQLEIISSFTQLIGINCPVLVNLSLMKNAHYFNGLVYQVSCTQINRPKQDQSVILSGGRYDSLIHQLKELLNKDDIKSNQHVVGFNLSLDKFIFSVENEEKTGMIDALIYAMGKLSMSNNKHQLLNEIWKSGIKTSFIVTNETLEEIQTRCKDSGIPVIVLLKESDNGFVPVRTLVKDRFSEKKVNYSDLVEYIWKYKNSVLEERSLVGVKPELKNQTSSEGPVISFVTLEKLPPPIKRRHENHILNHLQSILSKFSSRAKIEIIAISVGGDVIHSISQHIDHNSNELELSVVIKKHPKQKKLLQKVRDHLIDAKSSNPFIVIILYSLIDSEYNALL